MQNSDWDGIISGLRSQLQVMHSSREEGLRLSRSLIQTSSKCIRHIHRHQFSEAKLLLDEAKGIAATAKELLQQAPEILYAGFLHDAEKELAEAAAVMAIVSQEKLPTPEELNVMPTAFLNGLGEAASECRRFVLDEMRHGRIEESERILSMMEMIYDDLITLDFPDALTAGLRRTCDALRAVIERTRSDLTTTSIQIRLIEELKRGDS